jgi:DNA-binding transcriptional LysR family regulator
MTINFKLYASKKYISKFGRPQLTRDLDHHRLLTFSRNSNDFLFATQDWILNLGCEKDKVRDPYLEVNSVESLVKLMECGMGIASLSNMAQVYQKEEWIAVLPGIQSPDIGIYFVFQKDSPLFVKDLSKIISLKFKTNKLSV